MRSVCKNLIESGSGDLRAIVFLREDGLFQYYVEYFDNDRFESQNPPFWRPRSLSGLFEYESDATNDLEIRIGNDLRQLKIYPDEFDSANWGTLEPRIVPED